MTPTEEVIQALMGIPMLAAGLSDMNTQSFDLLMLQVHRKLKETFKNETKRAR